MKSLLIFGHANLIFVNPEVEGELSIFNRSDWQSCLHWRPQYSCLGLRIIIELEIIFELWCLGERLFKSSCAYSESLQQGHQVADLSLLHSSHWESICTWGYRKQRQVGGKGNRLKDGERKALESLPHLIVAFPGLKANKEEGEHLFTWRDSDLSLNGLKLKERDSD